MQSSSSNHEQYENCLKQLRSSFKLVVRSMLKWSTSSVNLITAKSFTVSVLPTCVLLLVWYYLYVFVVRCSGFNFTMCYACTCNIEDELWFLKQPKCFYSVLIKRINVKWEVYSSFSTNFSLIIGVHRIAVEPRLVDFLNRRLHARE